MMPTYLCDRCGKPRMIKPRINFWIKGKMIEDIGWIKICSPTGYVMTLDLCEDCMKKLSDFLKGDEANGGSKD